MRIVDHTCPTCGCTTEAPLHRMAAGDAGIWVCPECDGAFHLQIQFVSITSTMIEEATERTKQARRQQLRQGQNGSPSRLAFAWSGTRNESL